ncbi:MAG: hypothetical protein ACUVS4_09600, partial [Chloroflexaceae bacterium]
GFSPTGRGALHDGTSHPPRALTFDRRGSIIQAVHHNLAFNVVMRTSSPATAAREGASGLEARLCTAW